MKKMPLVILGLILVGALMLSGCTKTEYVTVTDTTTLPAVTVTQTASALNGDVLLADEGFLTIDGTGSFYYQRFDGEIGEGILFHDVIFTRSYYVQDGTTVTQVVMPLMYNITVEFQDDTTEILSFVGLPAENAINVNLTQHDSPQAGVMMVTVDRTVYTYILVSTT
jgi:hypothetical protein